MRNISRLVILILLFSFSKSYCQTDTARHFIPVVDTLLFELEQIRYDTVNNIISSPGISVGTRLNYDFTYQYPYYQVLQYGFPVRVPKTIKQWEVTDQIQLHFEKLPAKGYIYVFSVDGNNTPKIQPLIRIDSTIRLPFIYPDSLKVLAFEVEGIEHICLWYSTDSLSNAEKLIMGIELTMGSFVKRNNRQLGNQLLLPNYGWHFLESGFGFVIDPELHDVPYSFVLPIILEMEVQDKTVKKTNKSK